VNLPVLNFPEKQLRLYPKSMPKTVPNAPYFRLLSPHSVSATYWNLVAADFKRGFADLSLGPLGYRAELASIAKIPAGSG